MTRDDIIGMAREAGFHKWYTQPEEHPEHVAIIERFARAAFAAGVAAEREECAKIAESLGVRPELNVFNGGPDWYKHGKEIAAAIRARGQS